MERTLTQIKEHYEIEKELSNKLRSASGIERRGLYSAVYNEFFQRVPHHPQNSHKSNKEEKLPEITKQLKLLKRFLNKDTVFMEIGAGDCALSMTVAELVKQVYAVEVSSEISKDLPAIDNFRLLITDGVRIPPVQQPLNVVFSYQVMEHIHPEDALEQLRSIYDHMAEDGVYICITPNRINGPHDISRYFDKDATGFHLKEYTFTELGRLFKKVGFKKAKACVGGGGRYFVLPLWPVKLLERILLSLPYKMRIFLSRHQPFRTLLHLRIIGIK